MAFKSPFAPVPHLDNDQGKSACGFERLPPPGQRLSRATQPLPPATLTQRQLWRHARSRKSFGHRRTVGQLR